MAGGSWIDAVGPILQGVGAIADSFGGGSTGKTTNLQKKLLKFQMQMGTAAQLDARGNLTYYDKHSNTWKVVPSAMTERLLNASDSEQLQQYLHDLPNQRAENTEISGMRSNERGIADTLSRRILDQNKISPEQLEGLLYSSGAREAKRSYDSQRGAIATQALRQKADPNSQFAVLGQREAETMAGIANDAKLKSLTGAEDINNSRQGNAINAYNSMASQGKNIGNVPFNPNQLGTGLDALLSGAKSQAINSAYGQQYGIDNLAKLGQQTPYADLGANAGNLASGIGSILGAFDSGGKTTQTQNTSLGNSWYGQPQAQRAGF